MILTILALVFLSLVIVLAFGVAVIQLICTGDTEPKEDEITTEDN